VPELRNLHVDIGAADGEDARARVRIGDVAVIAGEPLEYPNGRLVSRSMDNRLGCYVAYEVARLVSEAVAPRVTWRASRSPRRRSRSPARGRRRTRSSPMSRSSST
jgi:putative aminopeptidase FrvX